MRVNLPPSIGAKIFITLLAVSNCEAVKTGIAPSALLQVIFFVPQLTEVYTKTNSTYVEAH